MVTFGIPEAISAMKIVLDIAVKLKNESKELALVEKEIRKVKNDLSDIEARMKNPKSPLGQSDAGMYYPTSLFPSTSLSLIGRKARIEEDSKDIKEGCAQVKKILEERARMHSLELGSKTWFVMYRVPELKVIIAGFTATTTSIDKKIQLLLADAAERAAASHVKAQKKAEEQAAASAKAQKKAEAQAKKLEEKMDKILEQQKKDKATKEEQEKNTKKLLELLEKQGRKGVQDIALGKGDGKKAADLVDELVSGGMKRKDAKAGVQSTMSAVRSESQTQKQTIKRAATDEAKKGALAAKPTAAKTQVTAKAGQEREVKKNNIWILCVDSRNGPRSIMAQTYLEFVRSWTMNTQKRWIFQRVHSIGVLTSSPFTKSTIESEKLQANEANVPVSRLAIEAIAGEESHFQTKDWPNEKGTILKRVREHKSQGLTRTHFERYEHIICFSKKTFDLLEKMKAPLEAGEKKIKVVSKIHLLQKCFWLKDDNDEKKEDILKMAGKLKVALKEFLKVEFKWERPTIGIASGEWRTLEILVDEEVAKRMKKDKGVLMNKILEKKGCTVHVAVDVADKCLVSISGPKGKLAEAQKMALA